jgi:hypothetical protein
VNSGSCVSYPDCYCLLLVVVCSRRGLVSICQHLASRLRMADRTPVSVAGLISIMMWTEASELLIPHWDADLRQRAILDAPWLRTRCWIQESASCWCMLRGFGLCLNDLGLNIASGYACRGTRHNHLPLNRLIPMMKVLQIHLMIMTITPYLASQLSMFHYVKTSNRSRGICNGPLMPVTSTHICNGYCLAPGTNKCARTTPGLASTTPVTNVDFW